MSDRELDAFIAEKTGWLGVGIRKVVTSHTMGAYDESWMGLRDSTDTVLREIPRYSSDVAEACSLIEKADRCGWYTIVRWEHGAAQVAMGRYDWPTDMYRSRALITGRADNLAMAICLAMKGVVEEEDGSVQGLSMVGILPIG